MATVPRSERAVRAAEAAAEGEAYCRVVAGLLRALRVQQGYSLGRLAARSGVSRWTISRIEQRLELPSSLVLFRLTKALGWTLKH